MALLQVENWDTFASLSDGSFKNYAQQSSPSFGEGSYLTPYTPRQSVTADGEGKGGVGKALRVPFMQEQVNLQDDDDNGNFYQNSGGGHYTVLEDPQATGETYIYAMWFKTSNFASSNVVMGLGDATGACFALRIHTDGHMYLYQTTSSWAGTWDNVGADYNRRTLNFFNSSSAGVSYGDSTGLGYVPLQADTWHFLEIKITLNNVGGSLEARIDNTPFVTYSGNTNRSGAVTQIDRIFHSHHLYTTNHAGTAGPITGDAGASTVGIVTDTLWDGIFIMDDSGSDLNDFLGPATLYSLQPDAEVANGEGGNSFSETGAASTHEAVETFDADTSYIEAEADGDITFSFGDLPVASGQVYAVIVSSFAKRTGVPDRNLEHKIGTSEAAAPDGPHAIQSGYTELKDVMATNPEDAGAWSIADVNALEVKLENSIV